MPAEDLYDRIFSAAEMRQIRIQKKRISYTNVYSSSPVTLVVAVLKKGKMEKQELKVYEIEKF